MGSCFGKKPVVQAQQTQQSNTTALQPVLDKYYGLLDRATETSYAPYDPNTGKQVAGFTAPQYQAFANIDAGIAAPYLNNASSLAMSGAQPVTAAGIQAYMDPYTNEVVNSTMADFGVQNARQISDVTGKARMAGSLGGDREAVVQALTQEQQNRVQAPVIAGLRSQGYSQALSAAQQDKARTLQASGLQANLVPLSYTDTQGLLMSGGMQQALDQARLDAASQNAAAASAYPFQTQQWLAGIMGAASPNMGSTTNSTGTKTQDEVGGKPNYVNAALGGISLLGSIPGLADGGRVPGIGAGGYIPQPIMPTGGIRPSNTGGDISIARSPTVSDHLSDVMGAIKQGRQAGKSLGSVGQAMRTDTGPGGWSNMVTYDSGNPLADFGNNLRYGISNVGNGIASAMGFAVGGEVPGFPTEPKMPFDEATGGAGLSPFMSMLAAEQGRGQGAVSAPGIAAAPTMTEPRVMERAATTAGVPYRDMPPPPRIANPGPGIATPASPPVEPPSSGGGISGAMQWFGTPEGKSALRNFGWNMLSRASPQYAGVGGTFQATGESGGLAERGWREDQKSMRERQIEDAKLALMKRAQDIRDAQAQTASLMAPYEIDLAKAKAEAARAAIGAGKFVTVDPDKMLWDSVNRKWITPPGGAEDRYVKTMRESYAKKAPEYLEKAATDHQGTRDTLSTINELKSLAPSVISGYGADQRLQMQKIAGMLGLSYDPEAVRSTEQYRALTQKFVLEAASKLKPLSNSDVAFVEKGLPNIERDPTALVPMLSSLQKIAERNKLYLERRMEALKRGQMPDDIKIWSEVDKIVPSPADVAKRDGARSPTPSAQPQNSGIAAPARPTASATAPDRAVMAMPDGLFVLNGRVMIKNGPQIMPAPADRYRRGMTGTIYDVRTGSPIRSLQ